jgi:hypothetical protein
VTILIEGAENIQRRCGELGELHEMALVLSLYNDGLIDDNSKMDREIPGKMAGDSKTFPIPAIVGRITCT